MLTAQQNLVQLEEIVEFLTEWRSNCKSGLAQGSRGATRLRGFITEELFNAFQLDLASFKFIIEFAVSREQCLRCRKTSKHLTVLCVE